MESVNQQLEYQHVQASDVLFAIVAAAGNKSIDLAHLQKVAFLVSEKFGQELTGFYTFRKHYYGPFCQTIYVDLAMLQDYGYIHSQEGKQKTYSIMHQLDLEDFNLPNELVEYIKEAVAWVIDMSFDELLGAIYYLFPEYHKNSAFRYSEQDAMVESFERAILQCNMGESFDARARLKELGRIHA